MKKKMLSEYLAELQKIYDERGDMVVVVVDDECNFYARGGPAVEEPCDHIFINWSDGGYEEPIACVL